LFGPAGEAGKTMVLKRLLPGEIIDAEYTLGNFTLGRAGVVGEWVEDERYALISHKDNATYERLVEILLDETKPDATFHEIATTDADDVLKRVIAERDRLRGAFAPNAGALLLREFPWLETDEDAGSGADVIAALCDLYERLKAMATAERAKRLRERGAPGE
jgi:hypothetical protein